uniref:Uncharacterized protein n=1 Tax=Anguilla anguilla TaxID=7936 RepID=A0A0E9U210_ANGAN
MIEPQIGVCKKTSDTPASTSTISLLKFHESV